MSFDEAPNVERNPPAATAVDPAGHAVTFMTTEHFNLQTARALTVSEANGRANIYLGALSSGLVALAFIGQASAFDAAFYAFALVLLPVLAFVGVVSFLRVVQSSIEDLAFAHRVALLRGYYLATAPELEPYLVVSHRDEVELVESAKLPTTWQLMLTVAGMVAVVNSVVVAASVALALTAAGLSSVAAASTLGAIAGAAAIWLHGRHHRTAIGGYRLDAVDEAAIATPNATDL